MRTERHAPASFKRQLATTVAVSISIVLIVSSVATAWIVSTWVRTSVLSHLDEIVGEFANRSVVVYLLQEESVAKDAASVLRSIPIVSSLVFLKPDYRPLFRDETLSPAITTYVLSR